MYKLRNFQTILRKVYLLLVAVQHIHPPQCRNNEQSLDTWVGKNSGPRDQRPGDPLVTSVLWNLHFPIHCVLVLHTVPVQVTVVNVTKVT